MMARALLLAAFVATSAGYVMNAPSPTSTRSAVQMFGGKKKITVNKPKPVMPTGKPMGPFSTQDFLSGVKPAKMTTSWPIASPFAKKQVVTKAKPHKKVVSSGNPIEGFEGLIASAFVIEEVAAIGPIAKGAVCPGGRLGGRPGPCALFPGTAGVEEKNL